MWNFNNDAHESRHLFHRIRPQAPHYIHVESGTQLAEIGSMCGIVLFYAHASCLTLPPYSLPLYEPAIELPHQNVSNGMNFISFWCSVNRRASA